MAGQSCGSGLLAVARRWWVAYITWRIDAAAIAHLRSASDRGSGAFSRAKHRGRHSIDGRGAARIRLRSEHGVMDRQCPDLSSDTCP